MNHNEIIYIRFTRTAYGRTEPFSKTLTVAEAIDALKQLTANQNRYGLEFRGHVMTDFIIKDSRLIAQSEGDYSHIIMSTSDLADFIQNLTVSQIFDHEWYPVSVEAWL